MSRANFLRLFPTPRYLAMPAVGVDISDQSVKFMQLAFRRDQIVIERYGEKPIPVGVIESGTIRDSASLIKILTELKSEHQLTEVVVSMPEEEAYIARLTLPTMKPSELRGSIELQLEEYVPLPAGEAVFDYEVIEAPGNKQGNYELAVSALPRRTVASYTEAFAGAHLRPLAFEVEAHATTLTQNKALSELKSKGVIDRVITGPAELHVPSREYDLILSIYGSLHYAYPQIREDHFLKYAHSLRRGGVLLSGLSRYDSELIERLESEFFFVDVKPYVGNFAQALPKYVILVKKK